MRAATHRLLPAASEELGFLESAVLASWRTCLKHYTICISWWETVIHVFGTVCFYGWTCAVVAQWPHKQHLRPMRSQMSELSSWRHCWSILQVFWTGKVESTKEMLECLVLKSAAWCGAFFSAGEVAMALDLTSTTSRAENEKVNIT